MTTAAFQGYLAYLPARSPIETFLLGLLFSIIAAKLVQFGMKYFVNEIVRMTRTELDDIVYEEFSIPVMLSIVFLGGYISLIPIGIPKRWMFYIYGMVMSVLTIFWAFAFFRAGDKFFGTMHSSEEFDSKFIPVFENVWKLVVLAGSLFGLLSVWKINVTPLLASAGIAGIAVGFAAKDTVANFFGGIALYFDNTYEIGDYVVLEGGDEGTVKDVGVRSTTLQTRDDELINVPNSVLNSAKIRNQSAPANQKRVRVPIGVAYGTDIKELEDILTSLAAEEDLVLEEPAPRAMFRGFGDSALEYELLCWLEDPKDEPRLKSTLNREIYLRLDEAGIEIPYPKRDVHMRGGRDHPPQDGERSGTGE